MIDKVSALKAETTKKVLLHEMLCSLQAAAVTYSRLVIAISEATGSMPLSNELRMDYWKAVFAIERTAFDAIEAMEAEDGN